MNDAPNTVHWKIGDLVIHDADRKDHTMLMRVEGYRRDGQIVTRYVTPWLPGMKKRYTNDPRFLHDPARFGIAVPIQAAV